MNKVWYIQTTEHYSKSIEQILLYITQNDLHKSVKAIRNKNSVEFHLYKIWNSLVAQWVKYPMLSLQEPRVLLWYRFNPWPSNSCMLWVWPKKKKINRQKLSMVLELRIVVTLGERWELWFQGGIRGYIWGAHLSADQSSGYMSIITMLWQFISLFFVYFYYMYMPL